MLSVSSSMNKLNVLSNFIGTEGGQALVDAAPPQLQTFCGFEEGQTEANLSGKRLTPGDAVLLAWELTTGYVSSSMTSINLASNELCGLDKRGRGTYDDTGIKAIADALSVSTSMKKIKVNKCELPIDVLKTGVQVDLSGRYLKVEDVIIIAACINVNSSMTKLAIWDNNIDMENATAIVNAAPAQMRTLCGDMFEEGQAEADLSGKKLGPEGAILVAWDLRAGFVSTSMNSVDLSSNELCGPSYARDYSGIKAIADALSVSSSMTSLNLASNKLVEAQLKLTKGARVTVDGQSGVISYGPDSDKEYKVKFDAGSESGYLKADKLQTRAITYTTGVQAIADALSVSTSMNSLK